MYYHFAEPVSKIAGHRVLAINRAEKEKMVNVTIEVPEREADWLAEKTGCSSEESLYNRNDGSGSRG